MQTGFVHLHNVLRWVILILLVLSIVKSFIGLRSGKPFQNSDRKTWLFTMIAAHITLLLGLAQLLVGRYGIITAGYEGEGSFMKNKFYRFFWVEHPLLMIIAIVLITKGYGMAKKEVSDQEKYGKALRYFIAALIAILVAIPWPGRDVVGRTLFPDL